MNKCHFIGNLCADPELRTTPTGISVCTFRIAVNRRFKDADGNQQTDFIPVTCWRQLADLCGKYLSKGKKVAISGSLQSRSYEDKSGQRRTAYDVVADEVEFLSPKGEASSVDDYPEQTAFDDMDDSGLPF